MHNFAGQRAQRVRSACSTVSGVFIITTLDNIGVVQKWVEHISHEESNYDFSKIEIQYVAEVYIK